MYCMKLFHQVQIVLLQVLFPQHNFLPCKCILYQLLYQPSDIDSIKRDYKNTTYHNSVVPEPGGPLAPQCFADQLTLLKPGRADFPHLLLLAPQCFSPSGITVINFLSQK